LASFAGMSRTLQRRLDGANAWSLRRLGAAAKKNRLLQCTNISVLPVVSQVPHPRCWLTTSGTCGAENNSSVYLCINQMFTQIISFSHE
jgi:hypothetical protein